MKLLLSPVIHFGQIYPRETAQWQEEAPLMKVFVATLSVIVTNGEQGKLCFTSVTSDFLQRACVEGIPPVKKPRLGEIK